MAAWTKKKLYLIKNRQQLCRRLITASQLFSQPLDELRKTIVVQRRQGGLPKELDPVRYLPSLESDLEVL